MLFMQLLIMITNSTFIRKVEKKTRNIPSLSASFIASFSSSHFFLSLDVRSICDLFVDDVVKEYFCPSMSIAVSVRRIHSLLLCILLKRTRCVFTIATSPAHSQSLNDRVAPFFFSFFLFLLLQDKWNTIDKRVEINTLLARSCTMATANKGATEEQSWSECQLGIVYYIAA